MITLSIDVTRLDKSKFVVGKKGTYCNLVLIETPNSNYGDFMVKQDCTKEERESGVQMPILGNGKQRERRVSGYAPSSESSRAPRPAEPDDDEIPF